MHDHEQHVRWLQAEQEIMQRQSFDAARRNSASAGPNGFGGGCSASMEALMASSGVMSSTNKTHSCSPFLCRMHDPCRGVAPC